MRKDERRRLFVAFLSKDQASAKRSNDFLARSLCFRDTTTSAKVRFATTRDCHSASEAAQRSATTNSMSFLHALPSFACPHMFVGARTSFVPRRGSSTTNAPGGSFFLLRMRFFCFGS